MKILSKINNGILLIVISLLHTQFCLSPDVFGKQFHEFSKTFFYGISRGTEENPAVAGLSAYQTHAAFWFFYFGLLLIPLGLLVFSIERKYKVLPHSFTISYLILVLIGSYMIPSSGMTFIMLPHAIFMLVVNYIKGRKIIHQLNN
jgi:hypothetical protein